MCPDLPAALLFLAPNLSEGDSEEMRAIRRPCAWRDVRVELDGGVHLAARKWFFERPG